MKIDITSFGGISPRTNPRYLPEGGSQVALNVEATGQSLKPLKDRGTALTLPTNKTIESGSKTIYRADMGADTGGSTSDVANWFCTTREASVCRSQIAGDAQEWTFYSTDGITGGGPYATYKDIALDYAHKQRNYLPYSSVRLGVPAPDGALTGSVTYGPVAYTGASVVLTKNIVAQMVTWNFNNQTCDVRVSIDKGQNWFMPLDLISPAPPKVGITMTSTELTALIPAFGIGVSVDGLATPAAWAVPASNSQADVITCINTLILRSGVPIATAVASGSDVSVTPNVAGGAVYFIVYWADASGKVQKEARGIPLGMDAVEFSLSNTLMNVAAPGYQVEGDDYLSFTFDAVEETLTVTTKEYCTLGGGADPTKTTRAECEAAGGSWTANGADRTLWLKYGPSSSQIVMGQGTTEDKGVYESRVYAFTWIQAFTVDGDIIATWESAPSPASEVANVYADSKVNVVRRYPGTCSIATYHDKLECEKHAGTWTPHDGSGSCSIAEHTNEGACVLAGGTWTFTNPTKVASFILPPATSTGWKVNGLRLYRSTSGVYLLVAEGAVTQDSSTNNNSTNNMYFTDDYKASQLGEPCPSMTWSTPPERVVGSTKTYLTDIINLPNGNVAGFLDRDVYFCEPYRPYAWPEEYQQTVDYPVVGLGAIDTTLCVLTTGSPYFIQGSHPSTMVVVKSDLQQACVSRRSIVSMEGMVLYASPDGLIGLTPGGSTIITDSIFRRKHWQDLNPKTIHAYGHDGKYIAFHDAATIDGVTYYGFILDMRTKQFIRHNVSGVVTGYADPVTDKLYLYDNTGALRIWEGASTAMPGAKWKSKKFTMPQITGFSCMQVEAESYVGMKAKLYRDGVLHTTSLTSNTLTGRDPIRLEAKQGRDWEVELDVTDEVFNIVIAQSPSELATS